ncbi:MAG: FAD-binding oxidoreductase, partial [Boseongicola sp.]|nr:FAD-binding oxidoreductase [Boseongicola sp.]
DFVNNVREYMGGDERVPNLSIQSFGYLYLADTEAFANTLRDNQVVQHACGAATELLDAEAIKQRYPFYYVDDLQLGSINTVNEGYWDGAAVFTWWRRQAVEQGVDYIDNEVVAITRAGARVESITLASGEVISCGQLVNASGPRAAKTAGMIGIDIPVEPRKRFSWVFKAEKPIEQELPLTIDPSGVHVRENGGGTYQCGGHSDIDPSVDFDDFHMDHGIWQDLIWPAIATRIPQFEAIKVISEWAGHYSMNTFDHNAITGPHPEVSNFVFLNGFSGHGLQQSPAMGRGTSEWLTYGHYKTLDLTPFHFDRVLAGRPYLEKAVI